MRVYKDAKFNNASVLISMPGGRKVLGPYSGMPMPMFRWSSLVRPETTYTTFSASGTTFTIRETTRTDKETVEELLAVPLTSFNDALLLGLENFQWEGWDVSTKTWELQRRPAPFQWTGNEFQGLTWRDE